MLPKEPRKRQRLSEYDFAALITRLQYLCELSVGGNSATMAAKLRISRRHLNNFMSGSTRASPRFLNHVASVFDVRPEWLLCGTGPVYRTNIEIDGLHLPAELQSSFCVFDSADSSAASFLSLPVARPTITSSLNDPEPYLEAGKAMHRARSNNKLTGFFLGRDSFEFGAAEHVLPFYKNDFAQMLCITLPAVCFDLGSVCSLPAIDMTTVAKFAANRGIGYGEAIGLTAVAPACTREKSVAVSVHDLGLPVTVAVELGEIAAHTAPSLGGAETGAAIGAAAYVDLLVLTEQLKTFFGSPGGVFVFAGEHVRGVRMVLERIESLRISVPQPAGFTFVVFAPVDVELKSLIQHHGGCVIFLNHPTTAAMTQLFQTCTDAYAGKI
jgi:transcriptional regulator with XRE-family HTH domain